MKKIRKSHENKDLRFNVIYNYITFKKLGVNIFIQILHKLVQYNLQVKALLSKTVFIQKYCHGNSYYVLLISRMI